MFYELGLFGCIVFAAWMALAYRTGKNSNEAAKLKDTGLAIQIMFYTLMGTSKIWTKLATILDLAVSIGLMRIGTLKEKTEPHAGVAAKVENLAAAVKRGRIAVAS